MYECNFFVFDTRLFSKKCWLKTGKSFILPPVAGTILGPKHCDGYQAPLDSGTVNAYDVPPPRSNYEEPETNYEEPIVANNYDAPIVKHNEPNDNYQEPESTYEEPDYKGL